MSMVADVSAKSAADANPHEFARAIALRQLDTRARSRWELEQKLKRKNVPEDVMSAVLDRLTDVGLIDDRAYAHLYVRSKIASKKMARMALRFELRKRGVAEVHILDALNQITDDSEVEMARMLVAKKLTTLDNVSRDVKYRRLSGLLGRKGYSHAIIRHVLADLN